MSAQSPAGLPPETPSDPAHEIQRGAAPAGETTTFGTPLPRPELMLGLWTAKRGQGKGYAGIVNALFYGDNCEMVYGDAAAVLVKMIEAVRGLGAVAA